MGSPRLRRRLLWAGGFLGLAAVAAGLVIAFPHPGKRAGEKTSPGGDIVVPDVPKAFAPRAKEVLGTAQQFVLTAVRRKNVDDSFDMVCPEMKEGFTRERWAKGDIPVVPYPAYFGKWRVAYSFENEVDVQVALFPKPKSKLKPVVFDMTMQPCGKEKGKQWLVSSFIPTPSSSGDFEGRSSRNNPFGIGTRNPKPLPNNASYSWLLVPVLVVGCTLLLVVGFFVLRGVRGRRAYAAWVRERQMSSSRPS